MKRTMQMSMAITAIFAIVACSKTADTTVEQVTIDTELAAGAVYHLNLSQYGKVANIVKQASNYSTSEITGSRNTLTYTYAVASKTTATEQVQIAVTGDKTSKGGCAPGDSTVVTVNLSIK